MKHLRGHWPNNIFLNQQYPWGCLQIIKSVLQIWTIWAIGFERRKNHFGKRCYSAFWYSELFSPASIILQVQKLKTKGAKINVVLKLLRAWNSLPWGNRLCEMISWTHGASWWENVHKIGANWERRWRFNYNSKTLSLIPLEKVYDMNKLGYSGQKLHRS